MIHLPVLRAGRPYRSLTTVRLDHIQTGEPVVEISWANTGLIGKDLLSAADNQSRLQAIATTDLIDICKRAADHFVKGELPLDDDTLQTPQDYVRQLSSTTGMPMALCRANMGKIQHVMENMDAVLGGLSRGLDMTALDAGWISEQGRVISYLRQANNLGVILPSNSPGVHSLWIPAIALKVPVVLRPGSQEPWTPFRIAQALMKAGCPREAVSFYPSDYGGSNQILMRTDRSMFFGDESTVRAWAADPRVQIHGPGRSKVLVAADVADSWSDHLEVMTDSIAINGGRSCLNASGIWVTAHGREVAEAVGERLAKIDALPMDHPEAALAAFSNPAIAERINDLIERQLEVPGAVDVTAAVRGGERLVRKDGLTYLLPTLIHCEDPEHPLASMELLFPFATVVQVPQEEMLERMGPSLVVTALTESDAFKRDLMCSANVDRLNLGPIPTSRISWDQPHEGNLFEHLYRQRAFQTAEAV